MRRIAVLAGMALALAGCSSSGNALFDLKVGDCLNSAQLSSSEITDANTVDCAGSHDLEIFAAHTLEAADYPGRDAAESKAEELCYGGFEAFVGVPYEASALSISWIVPTAASWNQENDREILCMVGSPEPVFGSSADSGR